MGGFEDPVLAGDIYGINFVTSVLHKEIHEKHQIGCFINRFTSLCKKLFQLRGDCKP